MNQSKAGERPQNGATLRLFSEHSLKMAEVDGRKSPPNAAREPVG
jgi:hypothetical protein